MWKLLEEQPHRLLEGPRWPVRLSYLCTTLILKLPLSFKFLASYKAVHDPKVNGEDTMSAGYCMQTVFGTGGIKSHLRESFYNIIACFVNNSFAEYTLESFDPFLPIYTQ